MPRTFAVVLGLALTAMASFTARADDAVRPDRRPITRPGASTKADAQERSSSGGFWLGTGGVAVALAAFGAFSILAKKVRPADPDSPSLRVVGRASLSARQSVYLLKVGDRTLILGAGAQGPPSLLGELTEGVVAPRIADLKQHRVGDAA